MGSKIFVKFLLGLSPPEVIVQLTGNRKELESIKLGIIESWPFCQNMLELCSGIEPLRTVSSSAKMVLQELYNSDTESAILSHLQTLLYSSEDTNKRDGLSRSLETILYLNQNLGTSQSRIAIALQSVINELTTKFSLEFTTQPVFRISPSSNFRQLSIISDENLKFFPKDLKKNVTKGTYESSENYLLTHFQLLLQDFLVPLRNGLSKINKQLFPEYDSSDELYSYGKIEFDQIKMNYDKISAIFRLVDVQSLPFDLEASQRLINGSLVVVVVDEKSFYFGTVAEKPQRGFLEISFLKNEDFLNVASHFVGNSKVEANLFESTVYYEAYCHVLTSLQMMTKVPFPENFIQGRSDVLATPFLSEKMEWDISSLFEKKSEKTVRRPCASAEEVFKILVSPREAPSGEFKQTTRDFGSLDLKSGMQVNPSQLEAVKLAMTKRLALIQGPPGTGKSFVGQILVRLFLSNHEKLWPNVKKGRPIMVVCFTNRALDSFLEATLQFTDRVVRIGGRSKSELLNSHNLNSIKKWSKDVGMRDGTLYKLEKSLEKELFECREEMSELCRLSNSNFDQNFIEKWNSTNARLKKISTQLEDVRQLENASLAKNADIVGMTTSGAAKFRHFVRMLDSDIVIVEEAGQVLESHVLTALTPNCQQLILIGDHQQLRPAVSTFRPGQTHGLDISLFERLVSNGILFARLEEQHRMRPEISCIVSRVFYPGLKDHRSVLNRCHVKGVAKDVFLVTHHCPEEISGFSKSKVNVQECFFLLRLAQHLVRVGNSASRITMLSGYIGQMQHMNKFRDELFRDLSEVVITVIDNYQGEENDIVLMSLVRSNEEGKIGFLNVAGRVCVSLSRAKNAMFVVGNVDDLLQRSDIWFKIRNVFESNNSLGTSLELVCPFHPTIRKIISPSDQMSSQLNSQHFCEEVCGELLTRCGHTCVNTCHIEDRNHLDTKKCRQSCRRSCSEGHTCQKLCDQICAPCEWTDDVKMTLNCGHVKSIKCPTVFTDNSGCQVSVVKRLPCGHEKTIACSATITECDSLCDYILKCGHACDMLCGQHDDNLDHNLRCCKPCQRSKLNCRQPLQHPLCNKLCFQICDPCTVPVDALLPCGHLEAGLACFTDPDNFECGKKCGKILSACGHICKSFCHECQQGCQACPILVVKTLPCGHQFKMNCSSNPDGFECQEKCQKLLQCGHPCSRLCWENCRWSLCQVLVPASGESSSCGHTRLVTCHLKDQEQAQATGSTSCQEMCGKTIQPCGHNCAYKCSQCISGLLHLPCTSKCERRLICGHLCELTCGVPCQPCAKKKCLFQPCHHLKCKAKCEDPCTLCKEKCGLGCEHSGQACPKKCNQACDRRFCSQTCSKVLSCGHQCPAYCQDTCPDVAHCPFCLNPGFSIDQKLLVLFCGHLILESEMQKMLSSPLIGIPRCSQCQQPIQFLSRYRKEMMWRKEKVLEVFDKYFALKSNVAQTKKDLMEKVQGDSDLDSGFKSHLISRCQDRVSPLTFPESQILLTKLALLKILRSRPRNEIVETSTNYLLEKTSVVGHKYVRNIVEILDKNFLSKNPNNFVDFVCFSVGSWSLCGNQHVYSTAFPSKTCPCERCALSCSS